MEDPIGQLPVVAQELLRKNDYLWDNWSRAYRPRHESYDQYRSEPVSLSELEDHGLFDPDASPAEKRAALKWLEERVKKSS
jgi:hypothetical protein